MFRYAPAAAAAAFVTCFPFDWERRWLLCLSGLLVSIERTPLTIQDEVSSSCLSLCVPYYLRV